MKAAILFGPNQIEIRDVPSPEPNQAGDAIFNTVLDMEFIGVCKTDQHLTMHGLETERILGHEIVCRLPNEKTLFAVNDEIACGQCTYCLEGDTNHCLDMRELGMTHDGGFAEKVMIPRSSLYPFEFDNPMLGVLIEPFSCALRGLRRIVTAASLLPVSQPHTLIIGGGLSGAFVTYLLTNSPEFSGNIHLFDINPMPLPWADALEVNRIEKPTPGEAHLVVECSGSPGGLTTAFEMVRNAGLICIYGVPQEKIVLPISPHELFSRELSVITTMAGVNSDAIATAIATIQKDERFFEQLLGRIISLEELPQQLLSWNPLPGTRTVVDIRAASSQ